MPWYRMTDEGLDPGSPLTGGVLDAIDKFRDAAVREFESMLGTYERDSREVREMIAECIPSWSNADILAASRNKDFHWCGIGLLTALRRAGVTDRLWSWDGRGGYGFVLRDDYGHLPVTTTPKRGDIFIGPPKAYHHGMFVERKVTRDGTILQVTIEANTPNVKKITKAIPRGLTYYSIEPLIRKTLDI